MNILLYCFFVSIFEMNGSNYFQCNKSVVKDVRGIEKGFHSERLKLKSKIFVSGDFFPSATEYELEQPLVFIRADPDFHIDPEVHYYFTSDDTIRLITHSWDINGVSKGLLYNNKPSSSKKQNIDVWNLKFDQLASLINDSMGKHTTGNTEVKSKTKKDYGDWKERNLVWESQHCTTELKMIWTEQNIKLGESERLIPTLRIRTKTFWPN